MIVPDKFVLKESTLNKISSQLEQSNRYSAIDCMQLLCSLAVVLIHVGTVVEQPIYHFLIKSVICRIAVPLFFISSAFFFRQKYQRSFYLYRSWLKRFLKQYFWISLFYLPLGIWCFSQQIDFKLLHLPIFFTVGFLYAGTMYHLWFFPALLLAFYLATKLIQTIGYFWAFLLSFFLYLLGAGETYFAYLKGSFLENSYQRFFNLFITTKNGLFFGLIFVIVGFYLADTLKKETFFSRHLKKLLFGSFFLFAIEAHFIYAQPGLDKNFIFALIPLSYCLFYWLLSLEFSTPKTLGLRLLSQKIYFFHLLPIELLNLLWKHSTTFSAAQFGQLKFLLGVTFSLVIFFIFEYWKKSPSFQMAAIFSKQPSK